VRYLYDTTLIKDRDNVTTGVSLMKLVKEMDAGPVFAQQEFNLSGHESKQKLANQLGELGAKMLIESLPKIVDGSLVAQPQIGKPTFTKRISKQDGRLDPSKSAAQLEREVRAYVGWPKSYFDWQGKTYIVHKANVATAKIPKGELKVVDKKLFYGCKDGSLKILEIQPAGKPKMNAAAFINGYSI
jgi:methionyl-tRNA formyltransferase